MRLSRAFTVRSRLNAAYSKAAMAFAGSDVSVKADLDDTNRKIISPDDAYYNLMRIGEAIAELNAAIEKANANSDARLILFKLNELKQRANMVNRMVGNVNAFQPVKQEYFQYEWDDVAKERGVYRPVNYKLNTTIDWEGMSDAIAKDIMDLEDKLADINANTEVVISEEVQDVIDSLHD